MFLESAFGRVRHSGRSVPVFLFPFVLILGRTRSRRTSLRSAPRESPQAYFPLSLAFTIKVGGGSKELSLKGVK